MKFNSIRSKLGLIVSVGLFVTVVSLITYATFTTRDIAIKNARNQAIVVTNEYASIINNKFSSAMDASRTLANMFSTLADENYALSLSRRELLGVTKNVLEGNPDLFATWTYWEPNAFDGRDAEFKNQLGCNSDGRAHSWFTRTETGNIEMQVSASTEENDIAEWYAIPKSTKKEWVTTPYTWPMKGKEVLFTSIEAPILVDSTYLGVVGNDVSIDFLQYLVDTVSIYNGKAEISIFSHSATIAGYKGHPEWLGKTVKEVFPEQYDNIASLIENAEQKVVTTDSYLQVATPIHISGTDITWMLMFKIPLDIITAEANGMMWMQIIIGFILLVISVTVVIFFVSRIVRPINKTAGYLEKIAIGDSPGTIDETFVGEFDSMKNSMNRVITANRDIIAKTQLFAQGDLSIEFKKRSENDELMEALNTMVETNRNIVEQARRMANGDLMVKLESRSEKDHLMLSLSNMVQTIAEIIDDVSTAAESVTSTGQDLSSIAQHVSSGAAQQAASAEQVSSSMEEMAAGISQNAEHAQAADNIAQKVTKNIRIVKTAVVSTYQAMKNIVEKISIVNEIAERTDLLAINAAIEAARAGEYGKGFTVVAGEVRQLAEKSLKAANEISDVSTKSLNQAEQSELLLQEIIPDIQKNSNLVQEISAASLEQTSGIKQVNEAMLQLTQVVQENSSSAEQLASNSEELASQAEKLLETIAFFKTSTAPVKDEAMDEIEAQIAQLQKMLQKHQEKKPQTPHRKRPTAKKPPKLPQSEGNEEAYNKGYKLDLGNDNLDNDYERF